MRRILLILAAVAVLGPGLDRGAAAQELAGATAPTTSAAGEARFPDLVVNVKKKQISIDCESLNPSMPLEFFLVTAGGNEHESVLRAAVRPSHLHLALLMLGLQPGEPVRYSPSAQQWLPPSGPPLHMTCEYELNGRHRVVPAYRMMRSLKDHTEMPPMTWVFAGSRVLENGAYAADSTGYLVSVVNFDLTVVDIPALASSANETLEWEFNPDLVPPTGTPVTLIIEPAGAGELAAPAQSVAAGTNIDLSVIAVDQNGIRLDGRTVKPEDLTAALRDLKSRRPGQVRLSAAAGVDPGLLAQIRQAAESAQVDLKDAAPPAPTTSPAAAAATTQPLSDVKIDQAKIDRLHQYWLEKVAPHQEALREAAQAHYDVINQMRREQQRLIDEADRIQRTIDELEKQYQDMTTPRPPADK